MLRKAPEKIGLILGGIERTQKLEAAGMVVVANARVVTGSQTGGANLAGHAQQRLELYIGVAVGAGDGSAAAEIVAHERSHDALFKLFLEVDDVVWKIQMLGDALGVVDI